MACIDMKVAINVVVIIIMMTVMVVDIIMIKAMIMRMVRVVTIILVAAIIIAKSIMMTVMIMTKTTIKMDVVAVLVVLVYGKHNRTALYFYSKYLIYQFMNHDTNLKKSPDRAHSPHRLRQQRRSRPPA